VSLTVALVNLTSGGLSGGYAKYLHALLPLLDQDRRVSALQVFAPTGVDVPGVLTHPVRTWPARDGLRGYRELRGQLAELAPDVIFFPTARLIGVGGIPTVVMVRNMEPLTVPWAGNTWREGLRNLARARAARAARRRATRVVAVSQYVRSFLLTRWHLDEDRVGVVYHGVEPAASGPAPSRPAAVNSGSRFLFTAGSVRPARGLEDVIGALPQVLRTHPGQSLVIAGGVDRSGQPYAARMRRMARALGVEERIVWAGHLSAAEMAWSFGHCGAFVVTSRAEACPNLALEAMIHGAPVVSTMQEPMPEFFQDSAVYYSPRDAAELALRIDETLSTPEAARGRARAGRVRAEAFTWRRTADRTIQELQRAVGAAA
jgi:glycosyltransferase involved in cell wall biosynthesis